MSSATVDLVLQALAPLRDPSAQGTKTLVEAGRVKVAANGPKVRVTIESGAGEETRASLEREARALIEARDLGLEGLEVVFTQSVGSREITSEDPLPGVKN
ncbi:MAG: hypothetical protein ACHREM_31690, partial [Polyangiales bacterium]